MGCGVVKDGQGTALGCALGRGFDFPCDAVFASCGIVQIHILFLVTTLPLFEGSKFSALQGKPVGVAPKVRQHGYLNHRPARIHKCFTRTSVTYCIRPTLNISSCAIIAKTKWLIHRTYPSK